MEEVCKHIRDIYTVNPTNSSCEIPFNKGKDFGITLLKKLAERGVIVDIDTAVGIYNIATKLKETDSNKID